MQLAAIFSVSRGTESFENLISGLRIVMKAQSATRKNYGNTDQALGRSQLTGRALRQHAQCA